jgi:hypothetical protein
MALITKINTRRAQKVDEVITSVVIQLSVYEAAAFQAAYNHIGGAPNTSGRGHLKAISETLDAAGIALKDEVGVTAEVTDGGLIGFKNHGTRGASNDALIECLDLIPPQTGGRYGN